MRRPPVIQSDEVAVFRLRMDMFEKMLLEIKGAVENLKQPKPINWIALVSVFLAFCGVSLSAILAVCGGGWLWLNVRLSPLEMRVAANEAAVTAARAEASRELTWFNSETQSRYNNLKDNVNRLYSRVFGVSEQPSSITK